LLASSGKTFADNSKILPRPDAFFQINQNQPLHRKYESSMICAAAMLGVPDCFADCIRFSVPKPTEAKHFGD
jgi:hypothetical protein